MIFLRKGYESGGRSVGKKMGPTQRLYGAECLADRPGPESLGPFLPWAGQLRRRRGGRVVGRSDGGLLAGHVESKKKEFVFPVIPIF